MENNEIKNIENKVDDLLKKDIDYTSNEKRNYDYGNIHQDLNYKSLYEKQLLINKSLFEEFNRKIELQKSLYESHIYELTKNDNDEIFRLRSKIQNYEEIIRLSDKKDSFNIKKENLNIRLIKLIMILFILFVVMYILIKSFN